MKNLGLIRNGLLTATFAAALMMSVSAVNATAIGFTPGAATGTSFNDFGGPALDVLNKVDVFQWTTLNDEQVLSGTTSDPVAGTAGTIGLGATEAGQSWFLSINDIGGDGASTDDTFTETFAFSLIGTQANDEFGTDQYGFGNESHVYMTITTTGTLKNISGDTAYDQDTAFALAYDTALFKMFFDVDGRTGDDVSEADIKIAEFSLISGGSTVFEADNSGEIRSDYSWNTSWDTAFEGVFDVPFGAGDATDGPGLAELRPGLLAFKLTDQDVRRNFDSAGSDSCDGNVCYLLTSDGLTTGTSKISVPESGTLALFGIGLLGLGAAMRRRKTV